MLQGLSHERILLVRADGLGDCVLGTGFMAGLRAGRPDAQIVLAARAALAPFFEGCPWVDTVMPFQTASPHYSTFDSSIINISTTRAFQRLDRPFDLVVDMQVENNGMYSSMNVSALAPAHRRIGAPMCGPLAANAMRHLYDEVVELDPCHEVLRYKALVECAGGVFREPALWDLDAHRARALALLGLDHSWWSTPKAFLHIGASDPRRQWPWERYGELAARLATQDVEVVVVGERHEARQMEAVARRAGALGRALPGVLTPLQLAAVMQGGGIFIGNDSGPMHLAAVSGLPVVEISMHPHTGDPSILHDPGRFGPWGVPFVVAQPDDFRPGCGPVCGAKPGEGPAFGWGPAHCILDVSLDQVWAAVNLLVSFDAPAPAAGEAVFA